MKTFSKALIGMICIALVGLGSVPMAIAADDMKITGTINDDGQLVDESGQAYEIAEEGMGAEAMEHSGEKISVTGMVQEEGGIKTIVIKSYKPFAGTND